MKAWGQALLIAAMAATGCATSTPAQQRRSERVPEDGPTRHRVKLAVLPVESDAFPRLAKSINGVFHDIQVTGIEDYFLSKVTLEVAQLAIECVDQTNDCWVAVGKSLSSDRMLLAQIGAGGGSGSGKKKKDKTLQLTVTYFDVATGQALHVANKSFKSEDEALRGMKDLIDDAVSGAKTASAGGGS
jgi:hypothetical protein